MMQGYAEYKDSGVDWLGKVPKSWQLVRIGSSFQERREKVSDKEFEPLSVTKNGILPQLANAAKTNDGDNRKLVRNGDFVINSRSDRKGSSGVAKQDGSVSLINIVMEPIGIEPSFCNHILKSNAFVEEYYRMGHGIVADLWTTRYSEMKTVLLALPSVSIQTAIAHFLDDKTAKIDDLVRIKQRQIELLAERKKILIQNAVTKGLNPDAPMKDSVIDWIGKIPAHWEVKRLASFGRFSKGGGFSKSDLTDVGTDAVLYGDIYTQYDFFIDKAVRTISPKVAEKSVWIERGDLLFTGSGETKEDIGKCVLFCGSTSTVAGGDVILFRQVENYPLFLSFCLNSDGVEEQKAKSSKGEIIVHTYGSKLKNIFIPIPPVYEQEKIAEFVWKGVGKFNAAITIKQNQITKLNEYKTTLINAAVTGKIKVA